MYATLAVALGVRRHPLRFRKKWRQSPGIFALIGFIYPAITIFALLVTFRDDFPNP